MGLVLSRLANEDPSFKFLPIPIPTNHHPRHGRIAPDIIVDRLKREFKVECYCGEPRLLIAKRLPNPATSNTPIRNSPVVPSVPRKLGRSKLNRWKVTQVLNLSTALSRNVPKEYIPGAEKGLRAPRWISLSYRRISGYRVKCNLYDGAYHEVDSNVMCFELVARAAFRAKVCAVRPVRSCLNRLLKVEVVTPEEYG